MSKVCQICGASMVRAFDAKILNKYEVPYFNCRSCGLLQTEPPFWLDEAYGDAIAATDTGLVRRNISTARQLGLLLFLLFDPKGSYLDVAGGYGLLTRLMRDAGFDFYWDDKYCANLHARGFDSGRSNGPYAAMTAFEVMEHVHEPLDWLQDNFVKFGSRTLIFSTELYSGAPPPTDWWYYSFSTGQHITFYRKDTFERMAERLGLRFYSICGFHILTDKPLKHISLCQVLSKRFAALVQAYIRRQMVPKTWGDHQAITRQMRGAEKTDRMSELPGPA